MRKINILLTFDYELPLGGIAKSFGHSLFKPAENLFLFAKDQEVPLTFFADILSYSRFKEKNIHSYTDGFENQLRYALRENHDVQLHIHPHWLKTEVSENTFVPSGNFRLAGFCQKPYPQNISGIVENSVNLLTQLMRKEDKTYKCIAYRGGGYNISPCTKEIIQALKDNGICYDSSVVPGYFFISKENKVDFRKVPKLPNWELAEDGHLSHKGNSGIWEVPIASIPKSPFETPTALKMKKLAYRAPETRGPMIHSHAETSLSDKFKKLLSYRMLTVDNYTYSHSYLIKIFDQYVSKFRKHETISLALIGHPKSMAPYSYSLLKNFIQYIRTYYADSADFTTFTQLAQRARKMDQL